LVIAHREIIGKETRMTLKILLVFVLGLLAGWLVEWVIDWVYWRRPKKPAPLKPYQSRIIKSEKKAITEEGMQTRVENLAFDNPALADVMASMLARPEMVNKSPEVQAMKMQNNLALWFDDVMDRSSGDYKRKASKWAWLLGTILAFALNVDSLEIATRMWREPTLRQVIVAQAQNYQGDEFVEPEGDILEQVNQLGIPVGWTTVAPVNGQQCGWMPGEPVYPAVWSNDSCQILLNLPRMDDGWGWLQKFFGLLISGIAAAQGAPFWFQMLNKVFNFRSSGRVPKTTRADHSVAE